MGKFNYYQAKELINREISNPEDQNLPPLKIEKDGEYIQINFTVSNPDMFSLVRFVSYKLVKELGKKTTINASDSDISLHYKNGYVSFYTRFGSHVHFYIREPLSTEEIEAIVECYKMGNLLNEKRNPEQRILKAGGIIYQGDDLDWDYLAGYEDVKQEIHDTIILPLQYPKMYDLIVKETRKRPESIRPKAVLFEGPPGTGKTTSARIIASQVEIPMVYIPIESIMSKWYGESERNLGEIFNACYDLGDSLIFLDEIDTLGISREKNIHEATRRVLSVLLRKIDGLIPDTRAIVIGATNRKADLDQALLSRFDVNIYFHLPTQEERKEIFRNYARHLYEDDLEELARESEGMSGRDIKEVCEWTERRWVSELLRTGQEFKPLTLMNT